jgi:hypothetical protein
VSEIVGFPSAPKHGQVDGETATQPIDPSDPAVLAADVAKRLESLRFEIVPDGVTTEEARLDRVRRELKHYFAGFRERIRWP